MNTNAWRLGPVAEAAQEVMPLSHVALWMHTPHKHLGGQSPDQTIAAGDRQRVLDLLAAMAEGVPL